MNLKEIRKNANLTQAGLADMCGCERSFIGKIENGAATPSVRLAKKIAKVLSFDWTLFYKEEEGENEEDYSGYDGRCARCAGTGNQSRPAAR